MNGREYKMFKVLEQIAKKPVGAWSNDPLTYRENVITDCMEKAKDVLIELELWVDE